MEHEHSGVDSAGAQGAGYAKIGAASKSSGRRTRQDIIRDPRARRAARTPIP